MAQQGQQPAENYRTFPVLKQQFTIEKKFEFLRELGAGAYGVVWYSFHWISKITRFFLFSACRDTELGINVAIKKIQKIFDKRILAKRTLRELKLLRHFNSHENVRTCGGGV